MQCPQKAYDKIFFLVSFGDIVETAEQLSQTITARNQLHLSRLYERWTALSNPNSNSSFITERHIKSNGTRDIKHSSNKKRLQLENIELFCGFNQLLKVSEKFEKMDCAIHLSCNRPLIIEERFEE